MPSQLIVASGEEISSNAAMFGTALVEVPCFKSDIGSDVSGKRLRAVTVCQ